MALQLCSAISKWNFLIQIHTPLASSPLRTLISLSAPHCNRINRNAPNKNTIVAESSSLCLSKRELCFSSFMVLFIGLHPKVSYASLGEETELVLYTDPNEGFTLLRPSAWIKVDKAGATVLFEEANKGINNIGVVVNPVRLASLGEYGTPQFVAGKLIQAEKRKESTKDAELIGASERLGHGGLQVYEFEYKVDSSRGGLKRIFSAAFVTSKKLYLLNITHSDKPESPLDTRTRMMLEEVLHSFDTTPTM